MRFFAAGASLFMVFIAVETAQKHSQKETAQKHSQKAQKPSQKGNGIKCEVCVNLESKDCSGVLTTCDKTVKGCHTAILEYNLEGSDPIYGVLKNCSASIIKNAMFRSAVRQGLYQLRVEVCQKDGCNKTPLQFPPINKQLNGVKCPLCNVTNAMTCEADGDVECFGEMTNCIYMAATFYRSVAPPVEFGAFRGCTSAKTSKDYPDILSNTVQDITTLEISNGV
ncbi:uncharacterized protein LOC144767730 [Lissotriton helveticus]